MPCKSSSGINIGTSKEFTVIKTVKNTVIKTVPVTAAQQSMTLQLWLKHPALRYRHTLLSVHANTLTLTQTWSKRLTVPDVVSDEDMSSGGQNHTRDSERPPGTRRIALTRYRTTQSPDITESERHARDSVFFIGSESCRSQKNSC